MAHVGSEGAFQPDDDLVSVLDEARRLGLVGPGPLEPQMAHAVGFAGVVTDVLDRDPTSVLDLGSGGGLPGLVLARVWTRARLVLLEAAERRAAFLERAVGRLSLTGRVIVRRQRAEVAGRDPDLRGTLEVVVSRSFGAPSVTAECAAPFLEVGGSLVVSSPPGGSGAPDRWPAAGLAQVGLGVPRHWIGLYGYDVLAQEVRCPDRFPRRTGVPAKRPLF